MEFVGADQRHVLDGVAEDGGEAAVGPDDLVIRGKDRDAHQGVVEDGLQLVVGVVQVLGPLVDLLLQVVVDLLEVAAHDVEALGQDADLVLALVQVRGHELSPGEALGQGGEVDDGGDEDPVQENVDEYGDDAQDRGEGGHELQGGALDLLAGLVDEHAHLDLADALAVREDVARDHDDVIGRVGADEVVTGQTCPDLPRQERFAHHVDDLTVGDPRRILRLGGQFLQQEDALPLDGRHARRGDHFGLLLALPADVADQKVQLGDVDEVAQPEEACRQNELHAEVDLELEQIEERGLFFHMRLARSAACGRGKGSCGRMGRARHGAASTEVTAPRSSSRRMGLLRHCLAPMSLAHFR
ncbi:hypothetical protein DSECCO2_382050 [anaerobic digester metagenome]